MLKLHSFLLELDYNFFVALISIPNSDYYLEFVII